MVSFDLVIYASLSLLKKIILTEWVNEYLLKFNKYTLEIGTHRTYKINEIYVSYRLFSTSFSGEKIFGKRAISADFRAICSKICRSCPLTENFLTRNSSILRHVRLIEVTITSQKSGFIQSEKFMVEALFLTESGKVGKSQGIHNGVRENHNIIITLVREKKIVIQ